MGLKDNLKSTKTETDKTTHKDIQRVQKKSTQIYITVSDDEKDYLRELARQNGMSVSTLCKHALIKFGLLKKPELKLDLNLNKVNEKDSEATTVDDELAKTTGKR